MISQYRFYLDERLMDDPKGWDRLEDTLRRDDELKAILQTQDVSLDFTGNAYAYLKRKFDNDGVLSQTAIRIEEALSTYGGDYETIYNGTVFTSDIEFNRKECIATAKIQDNSFYALINGNKSLEAYIEVGKSKNDIAITPCPRYALAMFDPCDGSIDLDKQSTGWRAFDILQFLVAFMSDGDMEFSSPVFGDGGDFQGLMLSLGVFLHQAEPDASVKGPYVSFSQVLSWLGKKRNLGFYIDHTGVKPKLVVDYYTNLFVDQIAHRFNDVERITSSTDVNRLYSEVKFGSTTTIEKGSAVCSVAAYYDELTWLGVMEENYIILGKGNIDKTLDLSDDIIISSNVIQEMYVNDADEYDDQYALIDCDVINTSNHTASPAKGHVFDDNDPVYYNVRFFNNRVAESFLRGVPNSIAKRLGSGSAYTFKAVLSANTIGHPVNGGAPVTIEPLQFDNDYSLGNDPGNIYGNGTTQGNPVSKANSRITISSEGLYSFRAVTTTYWNIQHHGALIIKLHIKHYDSSNTLKATYTNTYSKPPGSPLNNITQVKDATVLALAGDYLQVAVTVDAALSTFSVHFKANSYFEMISNYQIGGTFQTYDPEDFPVIKHRFKTPMALSDYKKLIGTKRQFGNRMHKIQATSHGETVSGWIDNLKYNRLTSNAEFTLTSDQR